MKRVSNLWILGILLIISQIALLKGNIYPGCLESSLALRRLKHPGNLYPDVYDISIGTLVPADKLLALIQNGRFETLTYRDGRVEWAEVEKEGRILRIREQNMNSFTVLLNEFRGYRPIDSAAGKTDCAFCKIAQEGHWSVLGEVELNTGRRWLILGCTFPLDTKGHFILIPKPEIPKHYPQSLDREAIEDALAIQAMSSNFAMAFNAFGSQPHIHFHGLHESRLAQLGMSSNQRVLLYEGVEISRLDVGYPAQGLIFQGKDIAKTAELVNSFIQTCYRQGIKVDMLLVKNRVYVFPRRNIAASPLPAGAMGALAMAKIFAFEDVGEYERVTAEMMEIAMRETTFSWEDIELLLDMALGLSFPR